MPEESPAIFAMFGAKLRFAIHLFGDKLKESPNLYFRLTEYRINRLF